MALQCLLPAVSPPVVFGAVPIWRAPLQAGTRALQGRASLLQASPSMQEDQMPLSFFSYPFSQTGWSWWLTPWPALKPQRHPGADTGRWGDMSEMPPLGPAQVLMPQSHRHHQGPFLTTDSVLRAPITIITFSTHLKSIVPPPSHTQENQVLPWCLSWKSR